MLADQERVEVSARPTGGQGVIAGVDEVGPHLVAGYRQAARGQSGHQSSCNSGLSVAGCGRGDDDAGKLGGYHSMPRWPFWPASIGCFTLVISVTRSAMSISSRVGVAAGDDDVLVAWPVGEGVDDVVDVDPAPR